jgi:hypothetical protein
MFFAHIFFRAFAVWIIVHPVWIKSSIIIQFFQSISHSSISIILSHQTLFLEQITLGLSGKLFSNLLAAQASGNIIVFHSISSFKSSKAL